MKKNWYYSIFLFDAVGIAVVQDLVNGWSKHFMAPYLRALQICADCKFKNCTDSQAALTLTIIFCHLNALMCQGTQLSVA